MKLRLEALGEGKGSQPVLCGVTDDCDVTESLGVSARSVLCIGPNPVRFLKAFDHEGRCYGCSKSDDLSCGSDSAKMSCFLPNMMAMLIQTHLVHPGTTCFKISTYSCSIVLRGCQNRL